MTTATPSSAHIYMMVDQTSSYYVGVGVAAVSTFVVLAYYIA